MEPLKTTFEDRTFQYAQLYREGQLAIFSQTHKVSGSRRYEIVKIHQAPETTWPDGRTTPEHEAYPGSTSWGQRGLTTYTLSEAHALLAAWQQPEVYEDGEALRTQP